MVGVQPNVVNTRPTTRDEKGIEWLLLWIGGCMIKKILNSKLAGYIVGILIAIGLGESFITTREEAEKFAK